MRFDGKIAVVTGAGRGIGRATALELSKAGATVVLAGIGITNITKVKEEIEAGGGKALTVQMDISKWEDAQRLAQTAIDAFGRIDLLVNNAGIHPHNEKNEPPRTLEIDGPLWDFVMGTNARGPFFVSKAILPYMVKQAFGRIVCVSSVTGMTGRVASPHYCASKAAIICLTKSLATEFGPHNITVNCVAPAFVNTDMHLGEKQEVLDMIVATTPLGRLGQPIDVARVILWFLVDDLFVTGQTLVVDGGQTMH